ncbi:hypothetical protein CYLTODRAFT_450916 [Cylindrobasidium torrendii FP15055 ss-10]|uniref:Uncharacterized protein n=1 Tax=Cylindrobasidium torrendii FP15055 ss-10 TaxID=1314674 RepID=A0A0D7BLF0_9AGAR|nr:hypothetical protein CYLTODRAFT_450916 [Cylindrobasidium torrendii FP15055 ss-10]
MPPRIKLSIFDYIQRTVTYSLIGMTGWTLFVGWQYVANQERLAREEANGTAPPTPAS